MKFKPTWILRLVIMIVAIQGFLLFIPPLPFIKANVGSFFGSGFFSALFLVALFAAKIRKLMKKYPWFKITSYIISGLTCVGLSMCLVFTILMIDAQVPKIQPPKAVIVLGAGLKNSRPSPLLARRLDAAASYLEDNEDAICIVSGGLGVNQTVTEAQAMHDYLIEKGISEDRILLEEKSTNTQENISYSKAILDEKGYASTDIALASDGFHQFRASNVAKRVGFAQVYPVCADTDPLILPTYWVREWFGIVSYSFN